MKTALIACFCLGPFAQALEVHEWGTFTVLSGSNGSQVPWYASTDDIAHLPNFILPATGGKTGRAIVRMETPVIYFYPEKESKVSVEVSFSHGSVTESFPHSHGGNMAIDPANGNMLIEGKWMGTLHPPTDEEALSHIPAIPDSDNIEPYGAAREVPDAWIFESDRKEIPGLKVQPRFPQMEKFIFYRGVSDTYIPISATMRGDDATLTNSADETVAFGTALRVRNGKAAWVSIPPVAGRPTGNAPAMNISRITFPKPERPSDEVESELADAWKRALAADGLTPAEASAMVETWRETWFRESGDRILTLVPRKTIDAMLPLSISPTPVKTERVFVARIEMISPDREQALVGLLSSTTKAGEADFGQFENLSFTRFANGAMEIAIRIQNSKMREKFLAIKRFGEIRETSDR